MNASKKYLRAFSAVAISGLVLAAALVYLIDPFFHYHTPWFGMEPVVYDAIYQNSGLASQFEYDSIIIGSSMSQNFDCTWFDEAYSAHTLKLTYPGATERNMQIAVDMAEEEQDGRLRYVFGSLDIFILHHIAGELKHELPEYLYDDIWYNDVSYLFNKDVIFDDCWRAVMTNHRGLTEPLNRAYVVADKCTFSKEKAIDGLTFPEVFAPVEQDAPVLDDNTIAVVDNVKNIALKYPDTEFKFFFSPFSMAYWYSEYQNGQFLNDVNQLQYTMEQLLPLDNVSLYFPTTYEMITDLDSYTDYAHYNMEIQHEIFEDIRDGKNQLTEENYRQYIDEFREMVLTCDFEELFIS